MLRATGRPPRGGVGAAGAGRRRSWPRRPDRAARRLGRGRGDASEETALIEDAAHSLRLALEREEAGPRPPGGGGAAPLPRAAARVPLPAQPRAAHAADGDPRLRIEPDAPDVTWDGESQERFLGPDRRRVGAARPAGRRPARLLGDRVRGDAPAAGLVRPAAGRRGRRRLPACRERARGCVDRLRRLRCRRSGPTTTGSSRCSSTCSATRCATTRPGRGSRRRPLPSARGDARTSPSHVISMTASGFPAELARRSVLSSPRRQPVARAPAPASDCRSPAASSRRTAVRSSSSTPTAAPRSASACPSSRPTATRRADERRRRELTPAAAGPAGSRGRRPSRMPR